MSDTKSLPSLGSLRRSRRAVVVSAENLVKSRPLFEDGRLPLIVEPAVERLDLIAWASKNLDFINKSLYEHGGVLFRGFEIGDTAHFETFTEAVSSTDLLEYSYRSTPRTQVSGKIYTSTEYPPDQFIPMHNEMAYSREWPLKISFYCVIAAQEGGETPIADSRKVWQLLDSDIREEFVSKKVMYVRNYGENLDLPWQDVFQAETKSEVEDFCSEHGIECEWKPNGSLRTRQICQAAATHPKTGDTVWFNQAHLFHVSALDPEFRDSLLESYVEDDLPRNAYFGDGSTIDSSMLDEIRRIYEEVRVAFPWQEGDILLLDNMLTAHGRFPFSGPRKVLVGMSEMFSV